MVSTRRSFLIGATAGAAGLATGLAVPAAFPGKTEGPSDVDTGFCRDMTVHHVQALAMCQRVLGRDTGDPIQAAASEVLQNQAIEVGMMRAWLADWKAPTNSPTTVMEWMGTHGGHGVPLSEMPGYASDADLTGLSRLSGIALGQRWLVLMRAHHAGGVHMAEWAADYAKEPKVARLAKQQVVTQTFEIEVYDTLLAGDYA